MEKWERGSNIIFPVKIKAVGKNRREQKLKNCGWEEYQIAGNFIHPCIQAKDLRALTSLQQKHKGLLDDMERRHARFLNGPLVSADEMMAAGHPDTAQLQDRVTSVQTKWKALKSEAHKRRTTLDSSTEAYQFFSDCNETDSVIKECITIAKSKDFGQDKLTALSLLHRHRQLNDKIQSIAVDVTRVDETGTKLINSHISEEALVLSADPSKQEDVSEKMVPVEVWEDEPYERTEIQKVIEDRKVPQVCIVFLKNASLNLIFILFLGMYKVKGGGGVYLCLGKNINLLRGKGNIMAVGKNIKWKKWQRGSNIIFPVI